MCTNTRIRASVGTRKIIKTCADTRVAESARTGARTGTRTYSCFALVLVLARVLLLAQVRVLAQLQYSREY